MKIYFMHDGQNQIGPFSPEELKERGITKATPIWREGLTHWTTAGEIDELKNSYANTPPPFKPVAISTERVGYTLGKRLVWIGLILVVIIVIFIIYQKQQDPDTYNSNPVIEKKSPEQLREELSNTEATNPIEYLKIEEATMHDNLIGEKIIKGKISNSATIANFKDVILEVDFLSKTKTELSQKQFIIYDYVKPNSNISFRTVLDAPSGTEGFQIKVIKATSVE